MGYAGFWAGLEYPPYPTVPTPHTSGSQGGTGIVQTPLRAPEGLNHILITTASLEFHPPAQLLTVTIGISTFPPLPSIPFLLHHSQCLCFAQSHIVATNSLPKSPQCLMDRPESFCVCTKPKHHPRNSKAETAERAKEMTPEVQCPRYFSTKFPWDCPWRNENALLHPSFPCSCRGWSAKELLQEEEADPGHLDKSLQGSRPARLLPRDKREAALLRGTDTGLISCAGFITVAREAKMGQGGRREGGSSDGAVSIPKC